MSALLSRPFLQFCVACETGSLTEAAKRIGVTQAAVSRGIRALESQLQIELFERDGYRLVPTEAGHTLMAFASGAQEDIRRLELELAGIDDARQGVLRIGVGPIWSRNPVPRVLGRLRKEFPSVRLEVITAIAPSLISDFKEGRLDLFVGEIGEFPVERGTRVIPLWQTERRVWAHADHALASKDELTLDELSAYPWIGHEHDVTLKKLVAERFEAAGAKAPTIVVEATSLEFILEMLSLGEMLAMLTDVMASAAESHGLVRLPIAFDGLSLSAVVVYHADLERLAPVRRILKHLSDESEHAFDISAGLCHDKRLKP